MHPVAICLESNEESRGRRMKILLSGYHNPHYETVTEYMERALAMLGHDLSAFDDRCHLIPGTLRERSSLLLRLDLEWINRRLLAIARRSGVQAVLVTGGNRVLGRTVRRLRSHGMRTALWTTDPPIDFGPILQAAPDYDHIFCQGTEAVELLHSGGVAKARWLPVGCDPDRHRPAELNDTARRLYGSDVVFVGSHYPERETLFEALAGFDLAIWGPGWKGIRSGSPLKKCLRGEHTTPDEWRKIYSASRIVLATHYQDPQRRFPVHQASPRVFEVMACGGFLICDRQRDILELFREGEHLVTFRDAADLARKVHYYLDHPEERQDIARKGHEEAVSNHAYVRRLVELVGAVNGGRHDGR
jgi:spore maturation protein CgeB